MRTRSEERSVKVARCVNLRFIHSDTDSTFGQLGDVDLEVSHKRTTSSRNVFAAKSLCRSLLNGVDHALTLVFLDSMEVVFMEQVFRVGMSASHHR